MRAGVYRSSWNTKFWWLVGAVILELELDLRERCAFLLIVKPTDSLAWPKGSYSDDECNTIRWHAELFLPRAVVSNLFREPQRYSRTFSGMASNVRDLGEVAIEVASVANKIVQAHGWPKEKEARFS